MAAERLLAQKSFDQITIEEIAEAAELAKGTFYHYFADKESIASEVALNARRSLNAEVAIAQTNIDDSALRFVLGICVFLRGAVLDSNRAAIVARMGAQWLAPESTGNEQLRSDLEKGYREGRFRSATPAAANVMAVGLVQAAIWRILDDKDWDATMLLATSLCAMALRAVGVSSRQAHSLAAKGVKLTFNKTIDPEKSRISKGIPNHFKL